MRYIKTELVIIGGGPAGMAAAQAAYQAGVGEIVILEREQELGGILQQCIHNGFGLHYFGEELTGPEYAGRFIAEVKQAGIGVKTNTMVLELTPAKEVYAVNREDGLVCYQARAVVLAMGCRERTREAIGIPGTRPAGVFTAGTAQRYINMEGYLPGKKILILGSGDIGLIMARRLTLEGAQVLGVVEIMPYSNGLNRNVVQCLHDYGIPLWLNTTVVQIHGQGRIEGVTVAQVDAEMKPVEGTEKYVAVDTLLLSVGLIPENELAKTAGIVLDSATGGALVDQYRATSVPGVFACGNVLHVHDLVDFVTGEAFLAGRGAAMYLRGQGEVGHRLRVRCCETIRYSVPQIIELPVKGEVEIFFRVTRPMERGEILVKAGSEVIWRKKERFLRPAEMVKVRLTESDVSAARLAGQDELELVVEEI